MLSCDLLHSLSVLVIEALLFVSLIEGDLLLMVLALDGQILQVVLHLHLADGAAMISLHANQLLIELVDKVVNLLIVVGNELVLSAFILNFLNLYLFGVGTLFLQFHVLMSFFEVALLVNLAALELVLGLIGVDLIGVVPIVLFLGRLLRIF